MVNPEQARLLLKAVEEQKPSGHLLMPFFATLYFAGLRPEEAVELREEDVLWPATGETWGWLHIREAAPEAGRAWTDSGAHRDARHLKHRAARETRRVPCVPQLVTILRQHLDASVGPEGRVFHGVKGAVLSGVTVRRLWDAARKNALRPDEYTSPLAKRPYDLRHACLSTWLSSGVSPQQVSEWAGNSPKVLLSTYTWCQTGEEESALRRIAAALGGAPWEGIGKKQPDNAGRR